MECCGTCIYNKKNDSDFCCSNEESESYGLSTMYDDCCEDYEEKE